MSERAVVFVWACTYASSGGLRTAGGRHPGEAEEERAAGQEPPAIRPHLTASDDPRLPALVSAGRRGSARVLQDLDGKWAVPGLGYGASIAALANAIRATVPADGETSTGTGGGIMAICDRVQLIPPTNPNRLGRNLAGGKATRLGPLALDSPKCLVEVSGEPFPAIQRNQMSVVNDFGTGGGSI